MTETSAWTIAVSVGFCSSQSRCDIVPVSQGSCEANGRRYRLGDSVRGELEMVSNRSPVTSNHFYEPFYVQVAAYRPILNDKSRDLSWAPDKSPPPCGDPRDLRDHIKIR